MEKQAKIDAYLRERDPVNLAIKARQVVSNLSTQPQHHSCCGSHDDHGHSCGNGCNNCGHVQRKSDESSDSDSDNSDFDLDDSELDRIRELRLVALKKGSQGKVPNQVKQDNNNASPIRTVWSRLRFEYA